jgi:hypothetical protein
MLHTNWQRIEARLPKFSPFGTFCPNRCPIVCDSTMSGKMFEPLNKNTDSRIRIHRLAIVIGVVSVLLLLAIDLGVEMKAQEDANYGFSYNPRTYETGIALGAILGTCLAILLFLFSLLLKWRSRK